MTLNDIITQADAYERELPPAPAPLPFPQGKRLSAWIDHTLLKPEATEEQIQTLCQEASDYEFASVCINPAYVAKAARWLSGSTVPVCTVIGFPLGATLTAVKVIETLVCLEAGAGEIDMVLNIGALKSGNYGLVLNEIQAIAQAAQRQNALVKVIFENALLTRREKIIACLLCRTAGADFVKTSTGFSSSGATVEDVMLMRRMVGADIGVKAAGGIRTLTDAAAMIQAGANRLGASAGVKIMREALAQQEHLND